MTMTASICDYCAHHNTGPESRCGHCGAPLRADRSRVPGMHVLGDTVAEVGRAADTVAQTAGKIGKVVTGLEKATAGQWRAALVGLALLGVLVYCLVHVIGFGLPPSGWTDANAGLPATLRSAMVCHRESDHDSKERCVVSSGSSLLAGGITNGREPILTVETLSPNRLSAEVSRWRTAGGSVIADGQVFAAIGPSATVWFADGRSGLCLESDAFPDQAGAKTFLMRSGLLR
ncbi:hypothetical protein [Nocardia sp. NPDC004722]